MTAEAAPKRKHRFVKVVAWIAGIALVLGAGGWAAFTYSPWPSSLLVRWLFEADAKNSNAELANLVTTGTVAEFQNLSYDLDDSKALLDVYYPIALEQKPDQLTTIVWVHGGGWVSGSKNQNDNYFRLLAEQGFTVVSVGYSIAPEATYPTPTLQVLKALDYLNTNAVGLHIDANKFVLAGDSAGGQIAGQVANVITNPSYAKENAFNSELKAEQLIGIILYCSALDPSALNANPKTRGALSGFVELVLWAYTGTKDFYDIMLEASPLDHLSKNFPSTFISVGNADPLAVMSYNFADKLKELNVPVDSLFFDADYVPALNHEYQFKMGELDEAKDAFNRSIAFLKSLDRE
ncbi:MAG: alpha/beta hydrolase [Microbacteriaceae bacterium]